MKQLSSLTLKPLPDALLYIPALFCPVCDDWCDFYLSDGKPFCDCCNDGLIATLSDIEKVSNLPSRAPLVRLLCKVGKG